MNKKWLCLGYAAGGVLQMAGAGAAPPPDAAQNPASHAWFETLRQSGSHLPCCSISNCRYTSFKEIGGHFQVEVDGWTYAVPNVAILYGYDNVTEHAIVCYNYTSFGVAMPGGVVRTEPQDTIEILCFLPIKPTS